MPGNANSWTRFVDCMLPPALRNAEPDVQRRARITAIGCLVCGIIHLGTSIAVDAQGIPAVAHGNRFAALLSFALVVALRSGVSVELVANGLMAVLLAFVLLIGGATGGDANSALHTAALLPGISILLSGRRTGLYWVVIVVASVAGLGFLRASGFEFPVKLPPDKMALSKFPGVIALTLGVSTMTLLYEWVKDRALSEVAEARRSSEASEHERQKMETRVVGQQRLESLGVLAGGVAHDFNNLLTTILGNASLIQDAPGTEDNRELAGQIVLAAEQAGDLTDQLLAYAGRGRSSRETVDVSDLVRRVESLVRTVLRPGIDLELDLAEERLATVADPGQIQQVVLNLVTNASQAVATTGTIVVRTGATDAAGDGGADVFSGAAPEGPCVHLEIQDDGSGMSPEILARIFDPFFTTKASGRGLGLSAALGIVHAHGGTIRVRSTAGAGTLMRVLLPSTRPGAELRREPAIAGLVARGMALVADDEESVRRLAARTLRTMGLEVLEAADGQEALVQIESHPSLRVVLLDDAMPVLRGARVLEELKARFPALPVVLSSGNEEGFMRADAEGPNITWLPKPYRAGALREAVTKALSATPT